MLNVILNSALNNPPTALNQPEVAGSIYLSPAPLSNPPTLIQNASGQGSIQELAPAFSCPSTTINQPTFIAGTSIVLSPVTLANPATRILQASVSAGRVVVAPLLSNPPTSIATPTEHLDVVQHPSVLSNPSTTIHAPASISLGVQVNAPRLSNPATTVLAPSFVGGATVHAPLLSNPATTIDSASPQTSVTTHPAVLTNPATSILAPVVHKDVVVVAPALSNPATTILAATVDSGSTIPVLTVLQGGATSLNQPRTQGTGTSVAVLSLSNPATVLLFPIWSSVDPFAAWPLELRQQRLYLERVAVFRKTRNLAGDPVWYLLYGNVPCKMFTTPNRDIDTGGAFLFKEPGVYLFNRLATVAGADIRAEDAILFLGPNQPDSVPLAWYSVKGVPETKASQGLRRANQQEVYLEPATEPPILGNTEYHFKQHGQQPAA